MTGEGPNADHLQPQVVSFDLTSLSTPCDACPNAEVWAQTSSALRSSDSRLQMAGALSLELLSATEPQQPIMVESVAFAEPATMCCNPALRLAETILRRTTSAVHKNDDANSE
jgi:hypothetical protein